MRTTSSDTDYLDNWNEVISFVVHNRFSPYLAMPWFNTFWFLLFKNYQPCGLFKMVSRYHTKPLRNPAPRQFRLRLETSSVPSPRCYCRSKSATICRRPFCLKNGLGLRACRWRFYSEVVILPGPWLLPLLLFFPDYDMHLPDVLTIQPLSRHVCQPEKNLSKAGNIILAILDDPPSRR
jgi:hypothetical protein